MYISWSSRGGGGPQGWIILRSNRERSLAAGSFRFRLKWASSTGRLTMELYVSRA